MKHGQVSCGDTEAAQSLPALPGVEQSPQACSKWTQLSSHWLWLTVMHSQLSHRGHTVRLPTPPHPPPSVGANARKKQTARNVTVSRKHILDQGWAEPKCDMETWTTEPFLHHAHLISSTALRETRATVRTAVCNTPQMLSWRCRRKRGDEACTGSQGLRTGQVSSLEKRSYQKAEQCC